MSASPDTDQTGLSRRSFLGRTAAGGAGIALAGGLETLVGVNPAFAAGSTADKTMAGYGELVPDPAGRLALPPGFSYVLASQAGVTKLDSGEPTPDRPDGTASFVRPGGNGSVLVQNHEISGSADFPVPHLPGLVYDPGAFGGTTTLVVDADGNRVSEVVRLAGTDNNCAGGRTPWNTWLSCKETEDVPTDDNDLIMRHGYVFEVDPYLCRGQPQPHADHVPRPVRPRVSRGRPRRGDPVPDRGRERSARAVLPLDRTAVGTPPGPRLAPATGPGRRCTRGHARHHPARPVHRRPVDRHPGGHGLRRYVEGRPRAGRDHHLDAHTVRLRGHGPDRGRRDHPQPQARRRVVGRGRRLLRLLLRPGLAVRRRDPGRGRRGRAAPHRRDP